MPRYAAEAQQYPRSKTRKNSMQPPTETIKLCEPDAMLPGILTFAWPCRLARGRARRTAGQRDCYRLARTKEVLDGTGDSRVRATCAYRIVDGPDASEVENEREPGTAGVVCEFSVKSWFCARQPPVPDRNAAGAAGMTGNAKEGPAFPFTDNAHERGTGTDLVGELQVDLARASIIQRRGQAVHGHGTFGQRERKRHGRGGSSHRRKPSAERCNGSARRTANRIVPDIRDAIDIGADPSGKNGCQE